MAMDPGVKQLWVAGLRSGLYWRHEFALHAPRQDKDRFCCLGVLCDLYLQEIGKEWVYNADKKLFEIDGHRHYLPPEVSEWAGIRPGAHIPIVVKGERFSIIDLSIDPDLNFDKIATVIEQWML